MIGSDISLVLRQGIWASLTGGYYHDPAQPIFNNTVHLYLWLFFFLTPLILDICFGFSSHWWLALLYAGVNTAVFAGIKLLNWRLHRIFDVHEVYSAEVPTSSSPRKSGGAEEGDDTIEAVEMVQMGTSGNSASKATVDGSIVFGDEDDSSSSSDENDLEAQGDKKGHGENLYLADVHQEPSSSASTGSAASYSLRNEHRYELIADDAPCTSEQANARQRALAAADLGCMVLEQITEDESQPGVGPTNADHQVSTTDAQKSSFTRKMSAPNFGARRFTTSFGETGAVRCRAHPGSFSGQGSRGLPIMGSRRLQGSADSDIHRMEPDGGYPGTDGNFRGLPPLGPTSVGSFTSAGGYHRPSFPVQGSPRPGRSLRRLYNPGGTAMSGCLSTSASAGNQLSDDTLRDIRHKSRKSYPGKSTSSVDLFLNHPTLIMKHEQDLRRRRRSSTGDTMDQLFRLGGFETPGDSSDIFLARQGSTKTVPAGSSIITNGSLPMSPVRSFVRYSSLELPSDKFTIHKIPEREVEVDGHYEIIKDDEDGAGSKNYEIDSAVGPGTSTDDSEIATERDRDVQMRDKITKLSSLRKKLENFYDSPTYEDPDVILEPNGNMLYEDPDQLRPPAGGFADHSGQSSIMDLDWLFRDEYTTEDSSPEEGSVQEIDEAGQPIYSSIRKRSSGPLRPPSLGIVTTPDIPELPRSFGGVTVTQSAQIPHDNDQSTSKSAAIAAVTAELNSFPKSQEEDYQDTKRLEKMVYEIIDKKDQFEGPALLARLKEVIDQYPELSESHGSSRQQGGASGRRSKSSRGLPPVPNAAENADSDQPSSSGAGLGATGGSGATQRTSGDNQAYQPAFADTLTSIMHPGTHIAEDHEDTTHGAIHVFQDEDGLTWMYTFDEDGVGTAQVVDDSGLFLAPAGSTAPSGPKRPSKMVARRRTTDMSDDSDNDSDDNAWIAASCRPAHIFNRNTAVTFDLPESDGPPPTMLQARAATRGTAYRFDLGSLQRTQRSLSSGSGSARSRYQSVSAGGAGPSTGFRYPLRLMMERTISAAQTATNSTIDPLDLVEGMTPSVQSNHYSSVLDPAPHSTRGTRARLLSALAGHTLPPKPSDFDIIPPVKRKQYYKIHIFPKRCFNRLFRLNLNRLQLMALLDRNRSAISCIFDVFLAFIVSLLAGFLLHSDAYHSEMLIFFCVVVSGSLFCLLKSVQPDAASPIHGFNWMVSYNRPGYFIILGTILLTIHLCLKHGTLADAESVTYRLYSLTIVVGDAVEGLIGFLSKFVLALPLIFTLGLLPQLNTFFMHVAEQLELHLFGGTASISFLSAMFALSRSLLSLAILTPLGWIAIRSGTPGTESTGQDSLMSLYLAAVVTISFWLSRSTSNIGLLWRLAEPCFAWVPILGSKWCKKSSSTFYEDLHLLSGGSLTATIKTRLKADLFSGAVLAVLVFAVHSSTLFTAAQPHLTLVLAILLACFGLFLHYLLPQMRKHNPWLLLASPVLKLQNYGERFTDTSQTMQDIAWFERLYAWLCFLERNVFYPVFVLSAITQYFDQVTGPESYFGPIFGCLALSWASIKVLRTAYCTSSQLYQPLITALLLFKFDFSHQATNLLLDFAMLTVIFPKFHEMYLKLQFIFVYLAPWQISWGSTFHAFAQPFTVPHSALLFAQAFLSSILSSPLNPFLGSVLFLMSYMRPVKFWEKDYNTRRVDNSNTRLISQIDRGPTSDDNNLNSIFYEHLTRSLQTSLAGDVMLGRMATTVAPGDCFILASEYLNCLLHIVELGNGFVTFQLRGLEFRGTYCQQREVEAIQEDVTEMEGCCCCDPGHLPHCLSFNTAFKLRWFSWEVTHIKYALQGYSITDNSASSLLQVYELRQLLVSKYVKCILFYAIRSPKLEEWLCMDSLQTTFDPVKTEPKFADLDAIFSPQMDEDFDSKAGGISRTSFAGLYQSWINYCVMRREDGASLDVGICSSLMALCYLLTLVGRRTLVAVAHNRHNSVDSFLYGLHALFKGDYRITSTKDEWIFADMDFLRCVIAPAVRMSLKLHQDHFAQEEYNDEQSLYEAISRYETSLFISHEGDPEWRTAVLSDVPSLLALRHVYDGSDGSDEYKVIMLNRKTLFFSLIKLNRECVRGLWAGQQQELIFLRNRNTERGSIQNARQVLRNMINSSADQPIGYPIYVSPLITSFSETNVQLNQVLGPSITLQTLWNWAKRFGNHIRSHCGMTCSSNVSVPPPGSLYTGTGAPGPLPPGTASTLPNLGTPGAHQQTPPAPNNTLPLPRPHLRHVNAYSRPVRPSGELGRHTSLPSGSGGSQVPTNAQTERYLGWIAASSGPSDSGNAITAATPEASLQRPHQHRSSIPRNHGRMFVDFAGLRGHLSRSHTHPPRGDAARTADRLVRIVASTGRTRDVVARREPEPDNNEPRPTSSGSVTGLPQRVRIRDATQIFDRLNETVPGTGGQRRYLVQWPGERWCRRGGRSYWRTTQLPTVGTEGDVVHRWTPCNSDMAFRSHIDKTILLLRVDGPDGVVGYVPVAEQGVDFIGSEV